ncbi:juvenile hormone esterase-like isoform X2 [Diabrotica virgifera virgifera]|uniref:Carboxylic ester hydrolase n=1 Tax=Diabrotica virgifera virgifera TaxID=50390 RepID=A0ABM5KZ90_DIAVI|nr:juvenile hormone esterase-like isoform X2 [Diabrotica virgifera virgifera]
MNLNLRLIIIVCLLLYAGNRNKGVFSSSEAGEPAEQDELIVELENLGNIRGHILQSAEGKNFYAFQDIPYAEPPIGPNRFRPPKPHGAWEGVLNVTENKKTCVQVNDPNSVEDCLVLNVYTPVRASPVISLPVFFWIHGGAFVNGNGSIHSFNPKFLIDYDIIIVTINYRLGLFGFLTTLDENIPGNLGLKDQLLALKWTYDHITRFGGDPKKITVGGESAGSMSAGFHLLSKAARGLITGIIQQSGSPLSSVLHPTNDRELAFEFGKSLNKSFTSTKSSDLLELLQQASYSELMALNNKYTSDEIFIRSTIRQAEAASRYVPVYLYELTWLPDDSTLLGVPHGTELWYLWDGISLGPVNEIFRKPLLKWWTNFIKYQNPTPKSDGELQNIIWAEVQPDSVKYLDINSQFTVKENPRHYYDFKNLFDLYTRSPYITY